ncbi:hypothetical protein CXB51_005538 [Gossypium anomalum]|uniref:Myb/SANT-like domain-containing protein n=1 Tax=Gossypium anomalum TaxID=47600 RepID=A0A8J6D5A4_9ROSI|nr:hypothetical protein CXB51_005538 [Gossypium anomalum]
MTIINVEWVRATKKGPPSNSVSINRVAEAIFERFQVQCDAKHVENHLRTVKHQWQIICIIQGESGFGWDDNMKMITCDKAIYDATVMAHKKYGPFLNKSIDHYDEMALVVGKDMAIGSFARTFAGIDLDDGNQDSVPIDCNNEETEETPHLYEEVMSMEEEGFDDDFLCSMFDYLSQMAAAAAPDHLFHLRNNFYLGSFQAAINNSDLPNLSPDDAVERDCLVYRSYIALGSYQLVINEIDSAAATPLQAVKLLALYLSNPHDKESTIASLKEWLADPAIGSNAILRLIAGIVFMHEEDYIEALKHTNAGGTMELHALNVQIFIKMHRSDYAERQLRVMQQIDEDHTLTQLANAWLNLAVGGSKIQEAYLIFQDFSEKYPMTGLILNGKAVCCMHMGNFDEAETLLLEALNKDAKDPETLANLVVCGLHLGKSSSRYLSQLKLTLPEHILVKRASSAEDSFERAVQSVA